VPGRFLIALVILLSAGHFLYAAMTYDALPQSIPIHFTQGGLTIGFAAKTWPTWLMLPGSGAITAAVSVLIGVAVMTSDSANLRLPRKEELMALPIQQRHEVLATFARPMIVAGMLWVLFFWTLQRNIFRVATGRTDRLDSVPLFMEIGVILFLLAFGTAAVSRRIRTLTRGTR
jgi:uncharacterized membrane protein